MGIRAKFVVIISILSLIATVAIGYSSYTFSRQNALADAKGKGEMLFNYAQASGTFFARYQHPIVEERIADKDTFIPELMSRFVVQRMTFEVFLENQKKGYQFKQATLDPLWTDNKANAEEQKIIKEFAASPATTAKDGIISKNGEQFFYIAKPVKIDKETCLICHGNPADAPQDQRDLYGTDHGYNWKMNEIVGANMVYISIEEALVAAKSMTLKIFLIGIVSLLVTIICIWVFLDRAVVAPIIRLANLATDISLGKNLCDSAHTDSKDEIGVLANGIDRLRISVNRLLKRSCPNQGQEKKE
jgi:HAMP domain-containing protein